MNKILPLLAFAVFALAATQVVAQPGVSVDTGQITSSGSTYNYSLGDRVDTYRKAMSASLYGTKKTSEYEVETFSIKEEEGFDVQFVPVANGDFELSGHSPCGSKLEYVVFERTGKILKRRTMRSDKEAIALDRYKATSFYIRVNSPGEQAFVTYRITKR